MTSVSLGVPAVRSGAEDADLAELWRNAMWCKAAGHGIDDPGFVQPTRPMSAIGVSSRCP